MRILKGWRRTHPDSRTSRGQEHRPDNREFYFLTRCDLTDSGMLIQTHGECVVCTHMQNICRAEVANAKSVRNNIHRAWDAQAEREGDHVRRWRIFRVSNVAEKKPKPRPERPTEAHRGPERPAQRPERPREA